jgi:hypothetical protein
MLPDGFDPTRGYTHRIQWSFSQDETLSILLHDADRIDRPGGPRPGPPVIVPCYNPDTYAIGAYVQRVSVDDASSLPRGSPPPEEKKTPTRGINWDYYEYVPRSISDRELCVSCFSSWERMAWPILRPWVTMDHFCEACAELKPVKRRWLHERARRLKSRKQGGMLEQIRREWMWADGSLPSIQFAVVKRQEELEDLKETFVCVLCRAERAWRNDWICEPCYVAWLRAGKPWGPALIDFSRRRRAYRLLHPPGGSKARLSACQRIEQAREYRHDTYTEYGRVGLEALAELDASGLPWRDRLQLFRQEVLPMLALPVELTLRGSPTQIVAIMRELVSAESSANQPGNGASSPRQAAARIPRLVGAISH